MNSTNFFLEFCKQKYQRQKECDVGGKRQGKAREKGAVVHGAREETRRREAHRWRRRGVYEGKVRVAGRNASPKEEIKGVPNAEKTKTATDEEGEAMQL
ncbi:hypothetical protein S83_010723 [Arachis hypogaea]